MMHLFNIPYLLTTFGYPGIFIIVFLESSIIFPLPGDSLLFTAGLFVGALGFNIYFLIGLVFVATFTGGLLGYEVGVNLLKLQGKFFFRSVLKPKYIHQAEIFFHRHGKFAVSFARFVPVVRTFVPIVAGIVKMDYKTFLKYSVLGSLLWSSLVPLLGFLLGHIFPQIADNLYWIVIIVVVISFLPMIPEFLQKRRTT